jgi:predicted RecB family nuclease
MTTPKGIRKVCKKGHVFYKSSDCPTCPVCEEERKPDKGFMSLLAAPARRALENAGVTTLKKLARKTEKEITELHGMGPNAISVLRKVLHAHGLVFKK